MVGGLAYVADRSSGLLIIGPSISAVPALSIWARALLAALLTGVPLLVANWIRASGLVGLAARRRHPNYSKPSPACSAKASARGVDAHHRDAASRDRADVRCGARSVEPLHKGLEAEFMPRANAPNADEACPPPW